MTQEQEATKIQIDLNHDASMVLHSATLSVAHILEQRAAMDQAGDFHKPLAVILGEAHDNPAHILHHMLLLAGLKNWREQQDSAVPLIFCHEVEHGQLAQAFSCITETDITPELGRTLSKLDPQGVLGVKAMLGVFALYQADFSTTALMRYVQQENIPNIFADCNKQGGHLDGSDPDTATAIARYRQDRSATTPVHQISPEGIRIRNHHMAQRAMEKSMDNHARIILFRCGNTHVVGATNRQTGIEDYPSIDSISSIFKDLGAGILAMPHGNSPFETLEINKNHGLEDSEFFAVGDLPPYGAVYNPFTNQPLEEDGRHDTNAVFTNRNIESAYLNALLLQTGLEDAVLTLEDYYQKRAKDAEDVISFCKNPFPQPASPKDFFFHVARLDAFNLPSARGLNSPTAKKPASPRPA